MNKRHQECSLGLKKSDIVLKNGNVLNVFTEEIMYADVAICDDVIVGVGQYSGDMEIDCTGKYIVPGLMDAHMHIESTMVTPIEISKLLVHAGTTTIIADPHEIVNVCGHAGMDYFMACRERMFTNTYYMIPSSVPATDMEVNGAGEFLASDMEEYIDQPGVKGLGETMRYADVYSCERRMNDKIQLFAGGKNHCVIDGHAPGLMGRELQAYRLAGVENEHECVGEEEMLEKVRAGFNILIREGSAAKNLEPLITAVLKNKLPTDRFAFCTDDKHTDEIINDGHINLCVRKSVAMGLPVAKAYKMATIQPAQMYGLRDIGAVAAGYKADIVIMENEKDYMEARPERVFKGGKSVDELVYEKSSYELQIPVPQQLLDTVNIDWVSKDDFYLKCDNLGKMGIIGIIPNQLVTDYIEDIVEIDIEGNFVPDKTNNKICVVERYGHTHNVGVSAIRGFAVEGGAIATTVSHDSHNLIVVGDNDRDIYEAVMALSKCGGGYAIASKGEIVDVLPLPIGGLLSDRSVEEVIEKLHGMLENARKLGVAENVDPFITLSFMALTVIPSARITDKGLVKV